MYQGKRGDLEARGATGDYYSIWFEGETEWGEGVHPDTLGTDIEGDAYDTWEEARDAAVDAIRHTGVFEAFLEETPENAWVAAAIERNELVDGVDRGSDVQRYPIMLSRIDGGLAWSYQDEFGSVEYEDYSPANTTLS